MTERRAFCLGWLFSPTQDLLAFALPSLFALSLTFLLSARGLLNGAENESLGPLGWLLAVVLVDVAHVYATLYRVYADPVELRRRWQLYAGLPILAYAAGVLLYLQADQTFWRVLAYLAVFHFVRQQYGWIALTGRKESHFSSFDRKLDAVAVYAGTLYPLLYWHAHLPRRYSWFIQGDFVAWLPPRTVDFARVVWLCIGALWLLRQGQRIFTVGSINAARLLVMLTTWVTWYVGIVHYDSDVAFTLTNVLPHGVPYFVLVYRYWRSRRDERRAPVREPSASPLFSWLLVPLAFYLPLAVLAFVEEGIWDRVVWHDHAALFPGPQVVLSHILLCLLVPLLALPQATHYLLDAWIWKVGPQNPDLRRYLRI